MNAIERLRDLIPKDGFHYAWCNARPCTCEAQTDRDALAAVDALYQAAKELLHEYEGEETEHGFPFNFALRDAHRSLAAAARRVDGEAAPNELPRPYGRSREDYPA